MTTLRKRKARTQATYRGNPWARRVSHHLGFFGTTGQGRSLLADLTPDEFSAMYAWGKEQNGSDLMRWPGWSAVAERKLTAIDPQGDSALLNKLFELTKGDGRDLTVLDLSAHEWTPDIEKRAVGEQ